MTLYLSGQTLNHISMIWNLDNTVCTCHLPLRAMLLQHHALSQVGRLQVHHMQAFGHVPLTACLPQSLSCLCRYEYEHGSGRVDYFGIYFVPLAPGLTRSFFKLTSRNAPRGFGLIGRIPPWLAHNLGANLNDQDAIMLHGQVHDQPVHGIIV